MQWVHCKGLREQRNGTWWHCTREYKPRAYHDRRSGNRRTSGLPSINIHILWQNFQDMFTMNLDWKLWLATGCWNYRVCTGQRMAKILRDKENANNIIPHGGERPYPSASTVSRQLVVMSLILVKIVHFWHKAVSHEMTVRSSDWISGYLLPCRFVRFFASFS